MNTAKEYKLRKSYRLSPSLVRFMEEYGKAKRWGETSIIEYALEELAKKEGYRLETDLEKAS